MIVLGITGPSGAGKTTLTNILSEKYQFEVIDADKVVKELSVPGTKYLEAIKENLGEEYFLSSGNLDRKSLAKEIYTDKKSLNILNSLTFEYVVEEIRERIRDFKSNKIKDDTKCIVIDAPLLFESNLDEECDYTIGVIADEEKKINRICARDNITREIAKKRLNIQQKDEFYKENANFVILNNQEEQLEAKIEEILKEIL